MKNSLAELAVIFARLGIISFGGPVAHIAIMRKEFVEKRKWITEARFLDLIGVTNLIPGPNSTEMAIHIGRERAGFPGLIVSGAAFILPAVLITAIIAWLYKAYGQLPEFQPILFGIKPAIIAIILSALIPLSKQAVKSKELGVIGAVSFVLCLSGFNEVYVMFGMGFLTVVRHMIPGANLFASIPVMVFPSPDVSGFAVFFSFLKIGAILYGSGYVLFAFLDMELVGKGILTQRELIDAIAVGQMTPGPVFSAVTFIGWQINGPVGAMLATVGVFLPAFVYVAVMNPILDRLRNSKSFSRFLDGVNVASIAIIASVCLAMGRSSITDWRTVIIGIISLWAATRRPQINSSAIVLIGAVLGYCSLWTPM